jgi:probable HAF family extracellular repeat protein
MRTAAYSKPLLEKLEERRLLAATLQPLGDFSASGVSADGSVVVGQSYSASGYEAIRWTAAGGMVGLGDLPGGGSYNAATAVSADGSVVVGVSQSALGTEAFRWTAGGGMVGLGVGAATGVNADGSVVVGGFGSVGHGAFRWTASGGKVGLTVSEYEDVASAVSADGSVIVGHTLVEVGDYTPPEAFRWTYEGGVVLLGDLPGGEWESYASGISADGSVVVGQSNSASGYEAFRWTSGGGMVGLGDLPGGEFLSGASAVSADGSVIVGGGNSASGPEAVRWTSGGGTQRLWDVLLAQGVNPAAGGWSSLNVATGVSADGNTIIGSGTRNGNPEAFIAVVSVIPDTKTYVGPNGGNWSTAANWSPSGVPTASDQVLIAGGSAVNLGSSATVAGLTLTGGASLTVGAAGDRVFRTTTLAITGGSGLNLNDNDLIVDYTGATLLSQIAAQLAAGRGPTPAGIYSPQARASGGAFALGVAEASDVLALAGSRTGAFAAQVVDATTVLVKYTRVGDADLDGQVDFADLVRLAQHYNEPLGGGTWAKGDFDHDAAVSFADLVLLAQHYNTTPAPMAGTAPMASTADELEALSAQRRFDKPLFAHAAPVRKPPAVAKAKRAIDPER